MASIAQFNNRVKVIAVAKVGAEFKKSRIIASIIEAAKGSGHVATGGLTTPSKSRSLTPFSDDRWLIRKDAVRVRSVALPSGEFAVMNIRFNVRYGLNGKYQNLSTAFSTGKRWMPPVNAISKWIRLKKGQGEFSNVNESNIKQVAFAIARNQKEDGIKQTNFADAFFDKRTGIRATLARGIQKLYRRLDLLYATSVEKSITKIIRL